MRGERGDLQQRLGQIERQKLERHLESIRGMERSLFPAESGACARPTPRANGLNDFSSVPPNPRSDRPRGDRARLWMTMRLCSSHIQSAQSCSHGSGTPQAITRSHTRLMVTLITSVSSSLLSSGARLNLRMREDEGDRARMEMAPSLTRRSVSG